MHLLAVVMLALLAPKETYELKYKFPKGLVYVENQTREVDVNTIADNRTFKWRLQFASKLRRSIVASDHNQRPTIERVEVIQLGNTVVDHPEKKPGTQAMASQGQTFIWRRMKERWSLFSIDDSDVTKRYPVLVGQLRNWRDARLPVGKVALGDSWEVSAREFLETSGQDAVPGVDGVASFELVKVEKGVAEISFDAIFTYRVAKTHQSVKAKGTWLFDVANGRDLSFEMVGHLKIDQGRGGKGVIKMTRKVSYQ